MDYTNIKEKMEKAINSYAERLAEVRAGRANPSILNKVKIDYYGTPTPINQVAGVSVPEARLIVIQPWDASILKEIEKAILAADIGINPNNDGKVIRLAFPELNEERRKEIVKDIKKMAEEAKVVVRNARRDGIDEAKKLQKDGEITEEVLNQSMEYSLMAGGKRLRPILVISTYKLFKDDIKKCIPYAVAIEMIHNFSLIHDDLPGIDNVDFRHGKPTNHKQFNEATAILAGDGLLNSGYITISNDLKNTENINELKNKIKVFNEFSIAVDRMIAGEYIDTEYEGKQISKDILKYIHENKTGALLKLSVRMGAMLADCSKEDLEKLSSYADKIGLAFQIKDDILSEEGNEEILGKPVGNDKEAGKCTYVSEYGLEGAKTILDNITKEAIEELKDYGEKANFLKELALYIQNRNK